MANKIGIITFHSSHNCGSMLQAYALQTVLNKKFNQDAEIINFVNKGSKNLYGYIDFRPKKSAIRHNLHTLCHFPVVKKSRADYMEFSDKYLKIAPKEYHNSKQLSELNGKYDIFVAGGDQVWNLLCPDADDAYYLDFVKDAKKVSYSPSFGGNNINNVADDTEKYDRLLKDFDFLSVREPNGQKWIKELTGIEVPIIADPTLLLTKEEWLSQFELPKIEEPFIFNYAFFHNNPQANTALQKMSKEMGMPVYMLDMKSWHTYRLDKYGIKCFEKTGPLAFISLMANAELVLTQSFHGTLFSALFHKQFWSYHAPIIKKKDDDRATAIMKQLGLSDRYVVIDDLPNQDYLKKIDYSNTDKLINDLREKAFKYIESFLK
ncbi:MAG: polysaccharide pyruvyl transferase family protein [Ruminococcus sp.]